MKKGKILYAGYDPDENDFTDCELAPLHDDDYRPTTLDIERACELKAKGKSWKVIGAQLAREAGREMPYHAGTVYNATRTARNRGGAR